MEEDWCFSTSSAVDVAHQDCDNDVVVVCNEPGTGHSADPFRALLEANSGLDLGFDAESCHAGASSLYEPSSDFLERSNDSAVDVGGFSSARDDTAAISDQFIKGARLTTLTMPWETPLMRQIFGEVAQGARLSMPLDWGDSTVPVVDSTGSGIEQPAIPSVSCQQSFQFIRHTTDATYIQQRDKTLQCALQKWRFLVMLEPEASDVGRQLVGKDEQETELVLTSVMGVKSPNTVLKRANALLLYYRWNSVNGHFPMVPFNEEDIWRYVQEQTGRSSSASRSQSLIQGLRFAHFVMGFHGALSCANSRRISGQAQIQLSLKAPVRQARPLTVAEVRTLHSIADGWSHSKVDKCIASTLLLMLYGRCRVSDVNYIHEILHDVSGSTGFLEVTTRYHKSARTAQQKALLMPILVGSVGVTAFPWIQAWISNRKACGLPTSGVVDGALMPAPLMGDSVQWLKRPLAPGEISGILKKISEEL